MGVLHRYWGKSGTVNEKDGIYEWHPVVYHCLDCAAVASAWINNSPAIKRALQNCDKDETIFAWVLFFVYMHDYGKLTTRFQTMNPSLWQYLFPEAEADIAQVSAPPYQHGMDGKKLFYKDNGKDPDEFCQCLWMNEASDHHHRCEVGNIRMQCFARKNSALDKDEYNARDAFRKAGVQIFFGGKPEDFFSAPPVPNIFKGFCTVCDWICSDLDFFPFETSEISYTDYYKSRIPLAHYALTKCGLLNEKPKAYGMNGLFPEYTPRGVQCVQALLEKCGLYIIEAPTGSGKTESALSIASSLIERGYADSILFALPTQATANSMFERLESIAKRMYPNGSNIVLTHGKSRFNESFHKIVMRGADRANTDEGLQQCSAWLATSKKRAFFGQIGVCTIDQVLMGALPIRHNFVRTFAIGRSVLIVDEVHAYDSYMNALLDKVLSEQRECFGNAVLLSATLPSVRKKELVENWSKMAAQQSSDEYPLVTVISPKRSINEYVPDDKPQQRNVHIEIKASKNVLPDDELLQQIVEYAGNGFAVAIICNLVSDAQTVWQQLKSRSPELDVRLFHSRYTFADRSAIENVVLAEYGKDRRSKQGSILVATQVIEQSLDLDFDFMVTQICPVELLFQRLGRLYRHKRQNRPDTVPHCVVLSPTGDDFGLHGLIYGNPAHLWRARALVLNESDVEFPAAYRWWIEAAHSKFDCEPELMTNADEQWAIDELGKEFLARNLTQMDARNMSECRAELLTRDGEMGLNLLPVNNSGFLLDSAKTELKTLHSDRKHLGTNEVVQLHAIPCPSGWASKLLPCNNIDGYTVITVSMESDCSWRYVGKSGAILTYSHEEGLRKE